MTDDQVTLVWLCRRIYFLPPVSAPGAFAITGCVLRASCGPRLHCKLNGKTDTIRCLVTRLSALKSKTDKKPRFWPCWKKKKKRRKPLAAPARAWEAYRFHGPSTTTTTAPPKTLKNVWKVYKQAGAEEVSCRVDPLTSVGPVCRSTIWSSCII